MLYVLYVFIVDVNVNTGLYNYISSMLIQFKISIGLDKSMGEIKIPS